MKVRPAVLADLPFTTEISIDAFRDDALYAWLHPRRDEYPAAYRAGLLLRQKHNLYTPGSHFYVAETEPDDQQWSGVPQITGYAIWERIGDTPKAARWQTQSVGDRLELMLLRLQLRYEKLFNINPSIDWERKRIFAAACDGWYAHVEDCWHFGPIAIAPAFQKQGVGTKLLQRGKDWAEDDRVPITLEAAPKARAFYVKHGFTMGGTIEWGDFVDPVFVYEPKGTEGTWRPRGDAPELHHEKVIIPC